jgi:NADP-dependent aldehyde dehydrogenase
MLVPLGPVAVYAASNFPFAFSVAGGDTAAALAAGCPVIVKAHPGHPETSRRTVGIARSALLAAGAPDGLISLVEGFEAGIELIDHPSLRAAAFTGSLHGGRALSDRAGARRAPIPFFGEYGAVNPVIVTPGADAARGEELAEGLAGSFTLGAGQFCTKPGIVLVPQGSRLQGALLDAVPDARQPMLTEGIGDAYVSGVAALSAVRDVTALRLPEAAGDPAILAVPASAFLAHAEQLIEEVFGPMTLLVQYRDESELLAAAARIDGSLTGTLHHDPEEDVQNVLRVLTARCGRVLFSGWPTGVAVSWAQHHGGPWPATNSQHTSVGVSAIRRFLRPLAFQDAPVALLPLELRDENPLGIPRRVDGVLRR